MVIKFELELGTKEEIGICESVFFRVQDKISGHE